MDHNTKDFTVRFEISVHDADLKWHTLAKQHDICIRVTALTADDAVNKFKMALQTIIDQSTIGART